MLEWGGVGMEWGGVGMESQGTPNREIGLGFVSCSCRATEHMINFGADPIRGGVPGALGVLGLNMGGASRGLPEKHFVKGKACFFKEWSFWKYVWF